MREMGNSAYENKGLRFDGLRLMVLVSELIQSCYWLVDLAFQGCLRE